MRPGRWASTHGFARTVLPHVYVCIVAVASVVMIKLQARQEREQWVAQAEAQAVCTTHRALAEACEAGDSKDADNAVRGGGFVTIQDPEADVATLMRGELPAHAEATLAAGWRKKTQHEAAAGGGVGDGADPSGSSRTLSQRDSAAALIAAERNGHTAKPPRAEQEALAAEGNLLSSPAVMMRSHDLSVHYVKFLRPLLSDEQRQELGLQLATGRIPMRRRIFSVAVFMAGSTDPSLLSMPIYLGFLLLVTLWVLEGHEKDSAMQSAGVRPGGDASDGSGSDGSGSGDGDSDGGSGDNAGPATVPSPSRLANLFRARHMHFTVAIRRSWRVFRWYTAAYVVAIVVYQVSAMPELTTHIGLVRPIDKYASTLIHFLCLLFVYVAQLCGWRLRHATTRAHGLPYHHVPPQQLAGVGERAAGASACETACGAGVRPHWPGC